MFYKLSWSKFFLFVLVLIFALGTFIQAQEKDKKSESIGGKEHDSEIYGVKIGMDIPTALETVFINAKRNPGQEKPDALKKEGKDNKDIRVLYKDLRKGELQIVFAEGKYVKEILLVYAQPPLLDDLRLPFTSTIGGTTDTVYSTSATQGGVRAPGVLDGTTSIEEYGSTRTAGNEDLGAKRVGNINRSDSDLLDGARYDDRYSIGFTDNLKLQKIWWRDEKTAEDYSIRVAFVGKKITEAGAKFVASIVQKSITVKPGDEKNFIKAVTNKL